MPTNGSVGTLTVSPRYVTQVAGVLDRERFDLLHFHEPFVPFLSLDLLRQSQSVNVATFHAYAGFSPAYEFGKRMLRRLCAPAPRPDRRQRGGAPLHRPLLPGRLQGHPQRRRPRPLPAGGARSRAGRTARRNILFVGRFEPRKGLIDLLKAYRHPAQDGLRLPAAGRRRRAAGARGAALHRDAPAAGVELLGRVSDAREGPLFRDGRRLRLAGHRPRVVRHRAARGDGRRRRRSCAATSTATRASSAAASRRCSCRRASRKRAGRGDRRGSLDDPELRARWAPPGWQRAEEFSWERITAKVDDYYGFVIRRLAAAGRPAADFHAASRLAAPVAIARGRAARRTRGARCVRARRASPAGLSRPRPAARHRSGSLPRRLALGRGDPPDPRCVADDHARDQQRRPASSEHVAEWAATRARPRRRC